MTAKTLKKMIKKVKKTSSFEVKSGSGGKLIASTSEDLAKALQEKTISGVQTYNPRDVV